MSALSMSKSFVPKFCASLWRTSKRLVRTTPKEWLYRTLQHRYFENPELLDEQTAHIYQRVSESSDVMNTVQRSLYHAIVSRYKATSVLDVGCGLGIGTMILRQKFPQVIGIDVNSKNLAFARSVYWFSDIEFNLGDVRDYCDGRDFDLIVCIEVIEHVADFQAFLEALADLMRPSTRLLISTPNRNAPGRDTNFPITKRHVREFRAEEFWHHLSRVLAPRTMYEHTLTRKIDPRTTRCSPIVVECGVKG